MTDSPVSCGRSSREPDCAPYCSKGLPPETCSANGSDPQPTSTYSSRPPSFRALAGSCARWATAVPGDPLRVVHPSRSGSVDLHRSLPRVGIGPDKVWQVLGGTARRCRWPGAPSRCWMLPRGWCTWRSTPLRTGVADDSRRRISCWRRRASGLATGPTPRLWPKSCVFRRVWLGPSPKLARQTLLSHSAGQDWRPTT